MNRLFRVLSAVAVAAAFILALVDAAYRTSVAGNGDRSLRTLTGWNEIADEHPRVIAGLIPGMYSVVTDDGSVYDVNNSAEPALRDLLDRLTDE